MNINAKILNKILATQFLMGFQMTILNLVQWKIPGIYKGDPIVDIY